MKSVISKLQIIVSNMRYIISDLLVSLDISTQMSASFNLQMTIIIIFTHSRSRKMGRTNVKSQRGCEREMLKGFFFTACFAIPFNLPLVGFWSNVACFDWKKRLHGYPKIQTQKNVIHPVLDTKKVFTL